ncbi:MAG: ribonucleotide-diphosphate reductase subunit alpha, partial [Bacteroidota bacterium]|nr:ribonucleotide-diphosphate reductase subunit alpha [Bacteroidota bacterium]
MENKTNTPHITEQKIDKAQDLINARKDALAKIKTKEEEGFEWLNEYSRQFLGSGYLTEGVTPEQRI